MITIAIQEPEFKRTLQPERKDISYQEILNNLLDKTDLDLKTQIQRPKDLATLKTLALYFKSLELTESGDLLILFIEILNTYMVSFNRESRKEIIRAISNIKKTTDGVERLTTNLK